MNRGKGAQPKPPFLRRVPVYVVLFLAGACVTAATVESTSTANEEPLSPTTVTSLATTTTGASTPTTTTTTQVSTVEDLGGQGCREDPFAAPFPDQLAARYPGRQITAHLYDSRTGCEYLLNPLNRQPTASVFKVLVLAGTLLEAQSASRAVSDWELGQLTPMITRSTNPQVRRIWSSFGASPWFKEQAEIFGLDQTTISADSGSAWGLTRTSAADQVKLLRQVLLGESGPIEPGYRAVAVDLMSSVVPEQTWGVTAGVPSTWAVAQKNGFAGATINSVGWVDEPGPGNGYVIAILSTGWPNFASGIAAVEVVNLRVADSMFDTVPNIE